MSKALKFLIFLVIVLFCVTGGLLLVILNADENPQPWLAVLVRNHVIVFVWHLVCWMVLGMFANYYWDLFNVGRGLESMQVGRILLPLLVSPVVFYPVYTLWLSSNSQSYVLFDVMAFQSGFFWQALFTKAKPLEFASNNIPWTVNNGSNRNHS